jgi:hypothetical protein
MTNQEYSALSASTRSSSAHGRTSLCRSISSNRSTPDRKESTSASPDDPFAGVLLAIRVDHDHLTAGHFGFLGRRRLRARAGGCRRGGAALGEPTSGGDDVTGGADDAVSAASSLQTVAPSDTMPKDAAASRVATFLTEIPLRSYDPKNGMARAPYWFGQNQPRDARPDPLSAPGLKPGQPTAGSPRPDGHRCHGHPCARQTGINPRCAGNGPRRIGRSWSTHTDESTS